MSHAFFHNGNYYLLPEGYIDVAQLREAAPCTVAAVALKEHHWKQGYVNGHSMAPYFISDYLKAPAEVTIRSGDDVFPAQVTLLTQREYNDRLRSLCQSYCPGCCLFGGVNEKDSSLRGHHDEITLDGLCLYRQEKKPAPPIYRSSYGSPRFASYMPVDTAEHLLDFLKRNLKLRYASGALVTTLDGVLELHVTAKKPDFFLAAMTLLGNQVIQINNARRMRLILDHAPALDEAAILAQLAESNAESFRKKCRQFGIGIGVLTFPEGRADAVLKYLNPLVQQGYLLPLATSTGRIYLLVADIGNSLNQLRYRSPMVADFAPAITVYDHEKVYTRRISFQMEQL